MEQSYYYNKQSKAQLTIVVWDKNASVFTIIEIGVPFDTNVAALQAEKGNKYMPLVSELQQMYPSFKYQMTPVIIGVLGIENKHQGKQPQNHG